MTVVNPKSISGINSITTGSGSDNLLTIHTSDASSTERVRINSSGDVIVGSGITVSPDGDIFATGVTTSTTFVGALTGNVTGNATGLSGTPNISAGTISGSTGTFTGDLTIPDKIVHTGDTDTAIRFGDNTVTVEAGGSERIRIYQSKILKGLTSARGNYGNNTSGVEYGVQIEGTTAITSSMSLIRNSNDANDGGIVLGKTRATSTGGNTVVQAGDDLGNLTFAGSDGTSLLFGAEIFAEVESGVGNDDMPTALVFKTNSGTTSTTERLRIDSSGRVLIGTTTEGNESADDLTLANSTNCGLSIRSGTSSNGSVFFTDATSGADEYRGFIQYQHSNDRLYFGTATTSKMYIEDTSDNGDVHVQTGNIVFDTSGKGIDFSATGGGDLGGSGTSELLDDYEEGTCTFTFVPASGSYGAVYTTGHYTKIGDIVHVTGSISINGQTSASGEVQISGLPFSVRGVNSTWSGEGGHGTGRWFYGGPNHFVHLVCDNSTDRMRVHKGDGTFLNHTDMNTSYNASQYSFTATYFHA